VRGAWRPGTDLRRPIADLQTQKAGVSDVVQVKGQALLEMLKHLLHEGNVGQRAARGRPARRPRRGG
jgi:hypothetical protein